MNTYRVTVQRPGFSAASTTVRATFPAVAVKRVMDGGHGDGYRFASVGSERVTLRTGERIAVTVERIA